MTDIDRIVFERDITRSTGFLSLSEQAVYNALRPSFSVCGSFLSGGFPEADRRIAIWPSTYTSPEEAEAALISCICLEPLNSRFADAFTHRDCLGALMNLGIERSCIGDILTERRSDGIKVFIFCLSSMAGFITDNLTKVRHTLVTCRIIHPEENTISPEFEELDVNVASERPDALISAVFKLSRSDSAQLIEKGLVYADGRILTSSGTRLKEGMRISVRGFGKFIFDGITGESRKKRLYVHIRKYI